MKRDPNEQGRFSSRGRGLGTVTEEMVQKRAEELANIAGRPGGKPLTSDILEARRELTGVETLVPKETRSERLPEDKRWEPVAESEGREVEKLGAADEQTFAEQLVNEGVEDAEQDLMSEAAKERARRDKVDEE